MEKPTYLTSSKLSVLGIKHGWFTRIGGVSEAPFDSMNVKKGFSDSDQNVDKNRRLALETLGLDTNKLVFIRHEHGRTVVEAHRPSAVDIEADAVVTSEHGLVLGQGTADCGTIIIADKNNRAIGLIHASWRTLKSGIIAEAVKGLRKLGATDLVAGLGPAICGRCYEFGPEAKGLFPARYLKPENSKYLVDLKAMMHDQLAAAGVREIDDLDICTMEDKRFFSHRRDADHQGQAGRFLTVVTF